MKQTEEEARDAALKAAYEYYGSSAGAYGFIWNAAAEYYKPQWVAISERLPDWGDGASDSLHGNDDVNVLATLLFTTGNVFTASVFYNVKSGKWLNYNGEIVTLPVTHWMPLPEPFAPSETTQTAQDGSADSQEARPLT